ncbi:MAG: membrane protein insertion efficiency factor YidD [Sciscionella sp.]
MRYSPLRLVLMGLLIGYRAVMSPLYGDVCRYYPSCSAYALAAVRRYGGVKGSWLAVRRLMRCHPWAAGGLDPVPSPYRWWGRADADSSARREPACSTH